MAKKKTTKKVATKATPAKKKTTAKKNAATKKKPAATKATTAPAGAQLLHVISHHGMLLEEAYEEHAGDHHRVVMLNAQVIRDGGYGAVTISAWDQFGNPTATASASVQFDSGAKVKVSANSATLVVPPHGRYLIAPAPGHVQVEFRVNQYDVT